MSATAFPLRRAVIRALGCLALLMVSAPSEARPLTLRWRHDDLASVDGFRVHHGSQPGVYAEVLDLGLPQPDAEGVMSTTFEVSDTDTAYAALSAYNGGGQSGFSAERVSPPSGAAGDGSGGDGSGGGSGGGAGDGSGGGSGGGAGDGSGGGGGPGSGGADSPPPPLYRLNAGGAPYLDPDGHLWLPDDGYFDLGTALSSQEAVGGTDMAPIYESERWHDHAMRYSLPLADRRYRVRIHLAELSPQAAFPGGRLFDLTAEGVRVLDDYDIFAVAGFGMAAVAEFTVEVADGALDLDFRPEVNHAKVCGIEVLPQLVATRPALVDP